MSVGAVPRALARAEPSARSRAIAALNYVTNHVISGIPSYRVRQRWYRQVVGLRLEEGSSIQLGCHMWSFGPGQVRRDGVRIGRRTVINRRCCLDARAPVTIGDDVSISAEVVILTTQHDVHDGDFGLQSRPVVIEDHVWIGMRAMVMPGVRVGRGAIVAAGAVVTRDVAPLTIVAGVPARPIGHRRIDPGYSLPGRSQLFE